MQPLDHGTVLNVILACCMADETYLPAVPRSMPGVSAWFREKSPDKFWVADLPEARVVGVIAATRRPPPVWTDSPSADWAELCRLAVHPNSRKRGLAAQLTEQVQIHAASIPVAHLWLRCVTGSSAQHYYLKRGWVELGLTSFDPPADIQPASVLWCPV